MNWERILKIDTATEIVKDFWLDLKTEDNIKREMSSQTMMIRMLNPNASSESMKNLIRESFEETLLNEKIIRMISEMEPALSRDLQQAGFSFDDVDWAEALIPLMARYDKVIDSLG